MYTTGTAHRVAALLLSFVGLGLMVVAAVVNLSSSSRPTPPGLVLAWAGGLAVMWSLVVRTLPLIRQRYQPRWYRLLYAFFGIGSVVVLAKSAVAIVGEVNSGLSQAVSWVVVVTMLAGFAVWLRPALSGSSG